MVANKGKSKASVLRNIVKVIITFVPLFIVLSCAFYFLSDLQSGTEEFKYSDIAVENITSILQEDVLVPIREIMKGVPITLAQNDTRILKYIQKEGVLRPPSKLPYNLQDPKHDPSMGQGQYIRKLLKNKENGFFVECGALDGETRSNTLYMEKELGWKGLLIEGDPKNYALLLQKNRRAWTSNACLSIKSYPHEALFLQKASVGKVVDEGTKLNSNSEVTSVQCLPLFSLLSYLNVTTVDYFSLDVEGNELDILKTIPFDSVLIKIISVEFESSGWSMSGIQEFFKNLGYIHATTVTHYMNLANDFIFVHSSLKDYVSESE